MVQDGLTFHRTRDYALIGEIMRHKAIYRYISDDFSPPVEQFRPIEGEWPFYLLVKDGPRAVYGLFLFHPENHICWKVHTCLLPCTWGELAKEAGKDAIQWIFANTPCQRIVTDVPVMNRLALKFAIDCGMERFGFNPASFQKNGALQDQILLGVSKG